MSNDREISYRAVRASGVDGDLMYEQMSPPLEPMLWIPDAVVAYCWAKGGSWRLRVDPLVREVKALQTREARLTNRPEGCRAYFIGATSLCFSVAAPAAQDDQPRFHPTALWQAACARHAGKLA